MKRYYLILLPSFLMLFVFLINFLLVQKNHVSRWRAGGFGMYSEVHPSMRLLHFHLEWADQREKSITISRVTGPLDFKPSFWNNLLFYSENPSQANLQRLRDHIISTQGSLFQDSSFFKDLKKVSIFALTPKIDLEDHKLRYEVLTQLD